MALRHRVPALVTWVDEESGRERGRSRKNPGGEGGIRSEKRRNVGLCLCSDHVSREDPTRRLACQKATLTPWWEHPLPTPPPTTPITPPTPALA